MMCQLENLPAPMLRTINPVEDRIDELIESLSKLKRMTRKTHDLGSMRRAQVMCTNEIEDNLDRVSDAIEAEIRKG